MAPEQRTQLDALLDLFVEYLAFVLVVALGKRAHDTETIVASHREEGHDPVLRQADVQRIVCPTLVVRGGRSDMFHDEDAEKLANALHDGRWIRIDDASHTVQGDQPLALLNAVRKFLGEVG